MMSLLVLLAYLVLAEGNTFRKYKTGDVIDLHAHSSFSDGSDQAISVIRKAAQIGLAGMAFVEHDQITYPQKAAVEAEALNVELYIGVELSCEWVFQYPTITGKDYSMVHLLGYFFDMDDEPLNEAVTELQAARHLRNELIVDILNEKFGFSITINDVNREAELLGSNTPGRVHIAQVLMQKGYVDSVHQAFGQYLNDELLQLPRWGLNLETGIKLISAAGGVAVLAHPGSIPISGEALEAELVALLSKAPLMGLEVYSSKHTAEQADFFHDLATTYELEITGGSDYHGTFKRKVELGLFGGADWAWRAQGWALINLLIDNHLAALRMEDDLLFEEGGRILVVQVSTYLVLFGSFLSASWYIQKQFDPSNAAPGRLGRCIQQSNMIRSCCVGTTPNAPPREYKDGANASDHKVAIQPLIGGKDGPPPPLSYPQEEATSYMGLIGCALGLNIAYIAWGMLQERIMTQDYGDGTTEARFSDSEFLVFMNRVSALCIAMFMTNVYYKSSAGSCPVFQYSFSSMSNIMSSWFQYEALKYISFPMQALAKSSKIVFTMLMGKVVSNNTYHPVEYLLACLITCGLVIYKVGGNGDNDDHGNDDDEGYDRVFILGCVMILGYIFCDSFTSTWQSKLFKTYKVDSWQMMRGVNTASTFISFSMLCVHGNLLSSIAFMSSYPDCLVHTCMMSICSAVGQMFIFLTIQKYGAVVFATIMTVRQILSILMSTIYYEHPVNTWGIVGMGLVFLAMALKVTWGYYKKKNKSATTKSSR